MGNVPSSSKKADSSKKNEASSSKKMADSFKMAHEEKGYNISFMFRDVRTADRPNDPREFLYADGFPPSVLLSGMPEDMSRILHNISECIINCLKDVGELEANTNKETVGIINNPLGIAMLGSANTCILEFALKSLPSSEFKVLQKAVGELKLQGSVEECRASADRWISRVQAEITPKSDTSSTASSTAETPSHR